VIPILQGDALAALGTSTAQRVASAGAALRKALARLMFPEGIHGRWSGAHADALPSRVGWRARPPSRALQPIDYVRAAHRLPPPATAILIGTKRKE
jgi:hypothetical protein